MTNQIVTVNVSQIVAPTPSDLQKKGAFISQGGTTTPAGTLTLLTALSDLTSILAVALANSTLAYATNVVTVTTAAPLGARYPNGTTFPVVISGATPSGYNGSFVATVTGASSFTYPHTGDPGAETVPGTWANASESELLSMATTFFAQGSGQAVYVLELGPGAVADGVASLATYISDNPATLYSFLVPRGWDADSDFLALVAEYESTTAKTYFFVTTTNGTFDSYTAQMKCVLSLIEAPAKPVGEFTLAAAFFVTLKYAPSATNKLTPLAFAFLFDVTAYPTPGNGALFTAWKAAGVNWVSTGAEGGISDLILLWGTTMDVRPFNYWYTVDWTQINIDLALSNEIIDGSNSPVNPLYFNQNGIDRLQNRGAGVLSNGVTYGMILGRVVQTALDAPDFQEGLDDGDFAGEAVINAIPFAPYNVEHPSDYKEGTYSGFSVVMTPLRGFEQIVFNISVTDFVA